jgi:hypothetical protein
LSLEFDVAAMASATGIPDPVHQTSEEEPLLGRVGDASQEPGKPFLYNLWIGRNTNLPNVDKADVV